VGRASGTPEARDDAQGIELFLPRDLPAPLAFDHAEILGDYLRFLETGEFPAPWRR
jgi:8-oxo-dGTP diphosphatase